MALHRHKVLTRPGPPEAATLLLVAVAVGIMLAGPLAIPGATWDQTSGEVLHVYRYQDTDATDEPPHHISVSYRYQVETVAYEHTWDGEWPEAHSPNALLAEELHRLEEPGFALVVYFDPENPRNSSLHQDGNRASTWWLRLAVALAALALWCVFVVYPRMKSGV